MYVATARPAFPGWSRPTTTVRWAGGAWPWANVEVQAGQLRLASETTEQDDVVALVAGFCRFIYAVIVTLVTAGSSWTRMLGGGGGSGSRLYSGSSWSSHTGGGGGSYGGGSGGGGHK
jgi:uncharacterized membrane protein YgcG